MELNASIVLDGAPPTFYIAPSNPPAPQNNLIFTSGVLAPGSHRLVVTGESIATLWTDYFLVAPKNGTSISASSSGSSTPPPPGPPSSTSVGAVVGGTIAAVVIVALAVLAIFLWRRRNRPQTQDTEAPAMEDIRVPRPFATNFVGSVSSPSLIHVPPVPSWPSKAHEVHPMTHGPQAMCRRCIQNEPHSLSFVFFVFLVSTVAHVLPSCTASILLRIFGPFYSCTEYDL
ncbi:hypothetical protein B0H17DRAFT_314988 [Mycena rosella]|uniref:Transmembrane protein n=1 Tax=Mycena rosella TaxID=1033263 RepID=A0AAD7CTJ2_MYCRO|nr:hypothetical protein B0H17DRAFT_314988 [Mycena rosella]